MEKQNVIPACPLVKQAEVSRVDRDIEKAALALSSNVKPNQPADSKCTTGKKT